jgi:hypothetical protein
MRLAGMSNTGKNVPLHLPVPGRKVVSYGVPEHAVHGLICRHLHCAQVQQNRRHFSPIHCQKPKKMFLAVKLKFVKLLISPFFLGNALYVDESKNTGKSPKNMTNSREKNVKKPNQIIRD